MSHYIVTEAVVPLRATPHESAEMISQLVFGERILSLTSQDNWLKVRNEADGYEGWATSYMLTAIPEHVSKIELAYHFVTSSEHILFDELNRPMPLPVGAQIPTASPWLTNKTLKIGGRTWQVDTSHLSELFPPSHILNLAHKLLYAPYLWGGRSSYGIDCSGFTQLCYKLCGLPIPRDSGQQWQAAQAVDWEDRKAADLVFFNQDGKSRISHVGILINPQEIIHASGRVRIDSFQQAGIVRKTDKKLTHKLVGIGRFF